MKIPKLCDHRPSGRSYVTDPRTRKMVYLGPIGSLETGRAYSAWVTEYLAWVNRGEEVVGPGDYTIGDLIQRYLKWADGYYRLSDGRHTSEFFRIKLALRPLGELFGDIHCNDFGPQKLKKVREHFVAMKCCRKTCNAWTRIVTRCIRWGSECEIVRPEIWWSCKSVTALKPGRTPATDRPPVQPVPMQDLLKVLALMKKRHADMFRLQLVTCSRIGEIRIMRRKDIDTSGQPWTYRPAHHKTEHHGRERLIYIPEAGQKILQDYLSKQPGEYLFPSPLGNQPLAPAHVSQLLHRPCKLASVKLFTPGQIRHTALTLVRAQFGLEASQHAGGHAKADVTQIYAERDDELLRRVVREMEWKFEK